MVFVLDSDKSPLLPCHSARARKLLDARKATVFRLQPFTIILKRVVKGVVEGSHLLKIDPGSKVTGIALVNENDKVVFGLEIQHRGSIIKKRLESRRVLRRGRRNRLKYRKPRFKNRGQIRNAKAGFKNRKGKLPPSIQHRTDTVLTWVKRLLRLVNVKEVVQELVRFDFQKMDYKEIQGTEYQQGSLHGFEVKEYLLEKYGRTCVYCGKKGVPLEVEHVFPKSKGGSNRVFNLVVACVRCNQRKSNRPLEEFLKKKPILLEKIRSELKKPLKDASAVNASRWHLYQKIKEFGVSVSTGSGGLTKFNRKKFGINKEHWKDAACTGAMEKLYIPKWINPVRVRSVGQGGRQKAMCDKFGYPKQHRPLKPIFGWRSGDIGKCKGKIGNVTPRSNGSFLLTPTDGTKPFSRSMKLFSKLHRMDGYVAFVA